MQSKFLLMLLFLWLSCTSAFATKCQCKQHPADAEANGTCSRTEDEKRCTLTFTATSPEEYQEFLSRLKKLGLVDDPHYILWLTYQYPPETYPDKFVVDDLPVLFAIS